MKRDRTFDALSIVMLVALTGCDCCKEDPPLRPDKCFTTTFNYFEIPDPYNSPRGGDCDDDVEPNEDLSQAATPTSKDCASTRSGHIDSDVDVDVFRTGECHGSRLTNVPIEIIASAEVTAADPDLRFCIFPLCEAGPTSLQSCSGDPDLHGDVRSVWDTKLDSGFVGCCRVGKGSLEAAFFCPQRSRTVDTYFWVDAGELPLANTCSPYTFTYDVQVD